MYIKISTQKLLKLKDDFFQGGRLDFFHNSP